MHIGLYVLNIALNIDSIYYLLSRVIMFNLMPYGTFFYAKIFVSNDKNKVIKGLDSLVCPAVMMLSYSILFNFDNSDAYIFAGIIFVWYGIWSLLGLLKLGSLKLKLKKPSEQRASQSDDCSAA